MPFTEWNAKLSVGVREFDKDHQRLLGLLNEMFDAIVAGRGKDVVTTVLGELTSYVERHFSEEERCLAANGYYALRSHKEEHDAMRAKVAQLRRGVASGATNAHSLEVAAILRDWLVKHIMGTDKRYEAFLREKGLK